MPMTRGQKVLLAVATVGVVLDLAISAVLTVVTTRTNTAASSAHVARVSTYEACLAANQARRDSQSLWVSVVALIPPRTPQARAFDAHVLELARTAFAERRCTPP